MRTPLLIGACLCACLSIAGGCRLMSEEAALEGRSPLKPARSSPDSVKMEIIWARFPPGDPALNDDAWRGIDETHLDPALRAELLNNGLRAGIINGTMPEPIVRVLNQKRSSSDEPAPTIDGETKELLADPIVHGRVRQLPRNQRCEISASEVYPSMTLLLRNQKELCGKPYEQAQAIYALKVDPQPDRTALVELTPELHHGAPRLRFTGGDEGVWHQAPLRDREVFDRLRMNVKLAPGDMLLVMGLPDAGSRLGHYFHTVDSSAGPQQKLILIRLAEIPPGNAFDLSSF